MNFINKKIIFIIISILSFILIISSLLIFFNFSSFFSFLLIISSFGTAFFLIISVWYFLIEKNENSLTKESDNHPSVAVVCTFSGESFEFLKKTIDAMGKIDYINKKLYLLDDSEDEILKQKIKFLCKSKNIIYITRDGREGFKSGNLNNFLFNYCKEEFLLIFDKDDCDLIDSNIIKESLPFFKDKKVAYVQTKKMTNKGSLFENSIRETNLLFYNLIQPINNLTDSALFGGSLALMEVKILKKLGGFPNYLIEDIAYSFKAILNGYKGKYINKNYVLSNKIESYSEFQKQQFRYNFSNTDLLLKEYIPNFFKIPFNLQYKFLIHFFGLHFLSLSQLFSIILLIFFMFYIPNSIILNLSLFFLVFLFPLTILLFSKEYNNSYKIGILAYLINFSLVFTRITALLKALFGLKPVSYGVTAIGKNKLNIKKIIKGSFLELIFFFVLLIPILFNLNILYSFLIIWNALLFLTTPLFLYLFG
ncbi:MAG: glycosyltransferase [Candidatus Micrarchaeia archaeon]|jgi:cellulose synthase/poly-beta-1,6-N-acetylglucosamine synthase-like glycosyltransferase